MIKALKHPNDRIVAGYLPTRQREPRRDQLVNQFLGQPVSLLSSQLKGLFYSSGL
ncbi:hypothetical protein HMPREF9103_00827 [Lentilactobacillus parafarraginis F0439]|uniref:Uncharacterized protein n=1 Tax=Lentilactobacillus parafarraginis F0439 TaxID=797515 RepID=G9ZM79_9LACO|nr:hypothetical protein HMPREF9103_00827 [Lentilactobacillus parafarraginis F0439]